MASGIATAFAVHAQEIVVGQIADQSGFYADATRDFIAGARTWFDHVNASGGIRGQRINLRLYDDSGDPAKTVELTARAIGQDRADVLFGFVGDANVRAAASSDAFTKSGIALVGPVSGLDPGRGGGNVFFTRASYEAEVRQIIGQFKAMGLRRIALAVATNESSRAVAAQATAIIGASGLEPAGTREIPVDGRDPAESARAIGAFGPQVVIVLADSVATAGFIKAYRQLDASAFLVGLSIVNHTTVMELIGTKFAAGTLITQVVPDPFKASLAVAGEHLRLMKKYRDEPPSHLTLEGFLAAKALVAGLQKARRGASRAEIATAMRTLRHADLGGIIMDFGGATNRGYDFVDIALLRKNGTLLR